MWLWFDFFLKSWREHLISIYGANCITYIFFGRLRIWDLTIDLPAISSLSLCFFFPLPLRTSISVNSIVLSLLLQIHLLWPVYCNITLQAPLEEVKWYYLTQKQISLPFFLNMDFQSMHMHTCMHTHIYTRTHIYIHIYICMYVCMYVCTHVHMHTSMHAHIHVCMYIYLHSQLSPVTWVCLHWGSVEIPFKLVKVWSL